MMIAVLQRGRCSRQQRFEAFLPDPQGLGGQLLAVQKEKVEKYQDQTFGASRISSGLHGTEGSQARLGQRAKLAIEIGLGDGARGALRRWRGTCPSSRALSGSGGSRSRGRCG